MKLHIIPILFIIPAILFPSCEAIPDVEFTDRPVVCCYLIPGETPTLTVKKVIPFRSDATFSSEDIDKLAITISDKETGGNYLLVSKGNGSYGNEDLVIEAGHSYGLSFVYDKVAVTAETLVPSEPEGVTFSSTTIEVMSFQPMSATKTGPQDGISINWTNDDGDYYIVEGKTSSTDPIYDIDDYTPAKSFKLSYTQGTSASLSSSDFNYYGTYRICVMHINEEYAVFSQGGSTDSTSLVDVKGNIDGAYGIFTGIGIYAKNIKVSKGSSPF